ncbi:MAG: glycoside hydrolase family 3 C-terminal domain-containing protein [Chloroflexota bacterium]
MSNKIDLLLSQMTLAEKVSLLAGSSMWCTTPIERLDIPAVKVTDGPNGARGGGSFVGGKITAACFPVGISLAATWNPDLVSQVGVALGEEAKSKGASMLLAPTVNIHRSPLNGRNFECYSEDPYLTSRIAVAYINGLQSQNVGACIKHYVCNDSEFERNSISSEVGERTLREIYLPPFKAAVQEANTWGIMAAYNKINGVYAGENAYTQIDILRKEWGYEGIVMSDWFGTKSTAEAVNGGLDLEMPGPPQWRGDKLLKAVQEGDVDEGVVDDRVRAMLNFIIRSGNTVENNPADAPEQSLNKPEHQQLIRDVAAEGIVLLKNEGGLLPLDRHKIENLAIIGPNAKMAQMMGGGSAQVNAHYSVTPFLAIHEQVGDQIELGYELGCINHKMQPVLDSSWLTTPENADQPGVTITYFNSPDLSGEPVFTDTITMLEQLWLGEAAPGVNPATFSARLSGTFMAPVSGPHTFSLVSSGLSRFYMNGKLLIDNWENQQPGDSYFGMGSQEVITKIDLVVGQAYEFEVTYSKRGQMLAALRLGCFPPVADDAITQAAKLASEAEAAVVFVGLTGEWESEGHDRPDMELAGDQVALIEEVAAANPNTVVVLQTGSPVTMDWADKVAGVIQAWYPGQECGNAITDVLFGTVNPSGKLPQTFPYRLEDNPAYLNYPGENGKVHYGEGIFVGYRYYEKKKIKPRFPFGFGLSYTSFAYSDLRLNKDSIGPEDELEVSFTVTNTGLMSGKETAQLYVRDPESSLIRPEKELKAFAKVDLSPGESRSVTLTLDRQSLAFYDDLKQTWVCEAGAFDVLVGSSSQALHLSGSFSLTETSAFGGPEKPPLSLSIKSTMQELLAHDEAKAILAQHLGELIDSPQLGMAGGFALAQMAGFMPEILTDDALATIDEALSQLS